MGTGSPEPLGVTPARDGANVAVFSAHASAIELCLYGPSGDSERERIMLPSRNSVGGNGEPIIPPPPGKAGPNPTEPDGSLSRNAFVTLPRMVSLLFWLIL